MVRLSGCVLTLSLLMLSAATVTLARAEEPSKASRFMRVTFDDKGTTPKYMETAIARYVLKGKPESEVYVDLIGAVHVGDKSYYDELNKEFENYDALLYELVAPKGTRIPKGTKDKGTGSAVSQIQIMMKKALALEFQLEQVDYQKYNFVHADMSPEQFSKSMKDLKEDPMTMFLRLMAASSKMQAENKNPPSDLVLMAALFDRQRGPAILKRIFAEQLANADVLLEALNGPQGSTIITERNRVALDTLEDEMKAGKKKLALFYGAAHLPDMEKKLIERFKMERKSTRWLRAWDLTIPTVVPKKPDPKKKPAQPADEKSKSKESPKEPTPAAEPKTSESAFPLPVTGDARPELASLDVLMQGFLKEFKLPGATLAVAKEGRIVYARGFGFADVEEQQAVQPESLFRIASISKPITAIGIFKLVESGQIRLEDRVWDLLNLDAHVSASSLPTGQSVDPRWKEVTVLHLLQHTGGWDRKSSFDPMFRDVAVAAEFKVDPPATPALIIRSMLARKLDFRPGERHAYSNFGYCLLGRVIETVTGKPYGDWIRANVLLPAQASHTQLGRTLVRAEGEVKYYSVGHSTAPSVFLENVGKPVDRPYGSWHLEAMDSHGGWLSTAVDLVHLGSALHDPAHPLLGEPMLNAMYLRPAGLAGYDAKGEPKDEYYAGGWLNCPLPSGKGRSYEHTGSLDGTSTLLVHGDDGVTFAVLFNGRDTPQKEVPAKAIRPKLRAALDAITTWPAVR